LRCPIMSSPFARVLFLQNLRMLFTFIFAGLLIEYSNSSLY
jgi:hypothetical protein